MERIALITTVCLNPIIDHMLVIDGFAYGGLNRVRDSRYDAGGKGLNVAVTASALGADCLLYTSPGRSQLLWWRMDGRPPARIAPK